MNASPPCHRRSLVLWIAAAVFLAGLSYFAPLFRIVPLTAARQQSAGAAFDASAFVDTFWSERLLNSRDQAVDLLDLYTVLEHDPRAARAQHARSLGLSSTWYYYVSATGRVASVEGNAVFIQVGDLGTVREVVIDTGPVFGNALRDGTGLLNVSDFANSQDFNAISSEINRRVEELVLPALRDKAAVGVPVHFVGCMEIGDEDAGLDPLRVVPLIVQLEP